MRKEEKKRFERVNGKDKMKIIYLLLFRFFEKGLRDISSLEINTDVT